MWALICFRMAYCRKFSGTAIEVDAESTQPSESNGKRKQLASNKVDVLETGSLHSDRSASNKSVRDDIGENTELDYDTPYQNGVVHENNGDIESNV